MISTVDPDARRRHEAASRGFDGRVAIDPEGEIVDDAPVPIGFHGAGILMG